MSEIIMITTLANILVIFLRKVDVKVKARVLTIAMLT